MNRTGPRIDPWRTPFGYSDQFLSCPASLRMWWCTLKITMASSCSASVFWTWELAAVELSYFRKTSSQCTWRPHQNLLLHMSFPLSVTSLASSHYGHSELQSKQQSGKILWARPVGVLELLGVKTAASFPPLAFCLGTDVAALKQIALFSASVVYTAVCAHTHTNTRHTHIYTTNTQSSQPRAELKSNYFTAGSTS